MATAQPWWTVVGPAITEKKKKDILQRPLVDAWWAAELRCPNQRPSEALGPEWEQWQGECFRLEAASYIHANILVIDAVSCETKDCKGGKKHQCQIWGNKSIRTWSFSSGMAISSRCMWISDSPSSGPTTVAISERQMPELQKNAWKKDEAAWKWIWMFAELTRSSGFLLERLNSEWRCFSCNSPFGWKRFRLEFIKIQTQTFSKLARRILLQERYCYF